MRLIELFDLFKWTISIRRFHQILAALSSDVVFSAPVNNLCVLSWIAYRLRNTLRRRHHIWSTVQHCDMLCLWLRPAFANASLRLFVLLTANRVAEFAGCNVNAEKHVQVESSAELCIRSVNWLEGRHRRTGNVAIKIRSYRWTLKEGGGNSGCGGARASAKQVNLLCISERCALKRACECTFDNFQQLSAEAKHKNIAFDIINNNNRFARPDHRHSPLFNNNNHNNNRSHHHCRSVSWTELQKQT